MRPSSGTLVAGWLLLITTVGCGAPRGTTPPMLAELPTLVEIATAVGQPGLSPRTAIVLGSDGSWLFASPKQTGAALVFVTDSTPAGVLIGGIGEGPGEARMPVPMIVDRRDVSAFDLAAARFTTWSRSGELVQTQWMPPSVMPIVAMPDGQILGGRSQAGGRVPVIIDPGTGKATDLVAPSDSLYRSLFETAGSSEVGGPGLKVVLGFWSGGVVIGNGETFTFGLFSLDGKRVALAQLDLPPRHLGPTELDRELERLASAGLLRRDPSARAQARERLAAERLPWVSHVSPPRSDGAGRLWIVRSGGADSVVAEIFAASEHLGSLLLLCPDYGGEWALTGDWFALVCGPTDPASDQDAVVHRYRIRDRAVQLTMN